MNNWYEKFMQDGRAKKKDFSEKDADPKQLAMGIKVEKEHTSDPKAAKKISLDHLSEDPLYYDHLKEMEDKYVKK